MQRALVLFNIESGSENQVLKNVKKVEGVEEAYISYGVYDLAVKVRADSMDALKDIISNRLRQIKKVRSTISLLLIEE
ncbi:MAG: Lrp/AsnC ligand binding domain-containing protein [Candidatus Bathyarchaeota archaeon]|jgi:DNA-binding Lrp family transcriptional regulator|nr:Lrp/AsnC ligand binding domain-containing protein [Candidatus Bathyarchaeota archaeon]